MLGVALLLLAAGGLCVGYAAADHWSYPSAAEIDAAPEAHDGERVLFFASVETVDRGANEMVVTTAANPTLELTVTGVPDSVLDETGAGKSVVQVAGVLRDGSSTLAARGVVVDYRGAADRRYTYLVSLLGAALAAGYFLWHWQVDLQGFRFVPRRGR
jgi:hypothetical protein